MMPHPNSTLLWFLVFALFGWFVSCGSDPTQNTEQITENAPSIESTKDSTEAEQTTVEPISSSDGEIGITESPQVSENTTSPEIVIEPTSEPSQDAGNPSDATAQDTTRPDNLLSEPTIETVAEPGGNATESVADTSSPTADYSVLGPLQTKESSSISYNVPGSTGCNNRFCTVTLFVTFPTQGQGTRQPPYPLAILSNGFLLGASQYASYAKYLASWGYVVVRWDTNQENPFSTIEHPVLARILAAIIDWAEQENKRSGGSWFGTINTKQTVLIGHSRGGKVSALAAQADNRVVGFFGMDPVNANAPGSGNASAFPGMSNMKAITAVVGADKSNQGLQACAPAQDNYAKFYDAAGSPAWELLLKDTGHMQFLDNRTICLTCLTCVSGQTPDKDVRDITQTAMVAWSEKATRNVDITRYLSGIWSQSWQQKGRLQSRHK